MVCTSLNVTIRGSEGLGNRDAKKPRFVAGSHSSSVSNTIAWRRIFTFVNIRIQWHIRIIGQITILLFAVVAFSVKDYKVLTRHSRAWIGTLWPVIFDFHGSSPVCGAGHPRIDSERFQEMEVQLIGWAGIKTPTLRDLNCEVFGLILYQNQLHCLGCTVWIWLIIFFYVFMGFIGPIRRSDLNLNESFVSD